MWLSPTFLKSFNRTERGIIGKVLKASRVGRGVTACVLLATDPALL